MLSTYAMFLERVRSSLGPLKLVVCDLSTSPVMDLAGTRMLKALHDALAKVGILLRLAQARSGVRDVLRAEGIEELVGYFGRRITVADVIDEFRADAGPQPVPI
jgi:MFS superfamily sulfate permease-like transporter